MVTHIYAQLDLGDLGPHDCLAVGSVRWVQTGPDPSVLDGHYVVSVTRVTVSIQSGFEVCVLDVTSIVSQAAKTDLEEKLEAARKKLDEGFEPESGDEE